MSAALEGIVLALGERKVRTLLALAAASPSAPLTAAERRLVGGRARPGTGTRPASRTRAA